MVYTKENVEEIEKDLFLMVEASRRIYEVEEYRRIKTSYKRASRIINMYINNVIEKG